VATEEIRGNPASRHASPADRLACLPPVVRRHLASRARATGAHRGGRSGVSGLGGRSGLSRRTRVRSVPYTGHRRFPQIRDGTHRRVAERKTARSDRCVILAVGQAQTGRRRRPVVGGLRYSGAAPAHHYVVTTHETLVLLLGSWEESDWGRFPTRQCRELCLRGRAWRERRDDPEHRASAQVGVLGRRPVPLLGRAAGSAHRYHPTAVQLQARRADLLRGLRRAHGPHG